MPLQALNYFGARYYDAEIGLWTAVDPKHQYFNLYRYCGNNPLNRIDPDGKIDDNLWEMMQDDPERAEGYLWSFTPEEAEAVKGGVEKVLLTEAAVLSVPILAVAAPEATAVVLSNPKATATAVAITIDAADAALGVEDPTDRGLTGIKQVFTMISEMFKNRPTNNNKVMEIDGK